MSDWLQCPLFKGIPDDKLQKMLEGHFTLKRYKTGEVIALQGSRYEKLFIVSQGSVRGEMTDALGRSTLIEEIQAPRAVAPAFLYTTENRLPVSILAAEPCEIAALSRSTFTRLMQRDERLLTNYLNSMADRSRFLSEKLRLQRFGTIRSKLARYLLEMSQRLALAQNQTKSLESFIIPHTQQELADLFGVTRPALARCIGELEKEGLVEVRGKNYRLLDRNRLMQL